VSGNAWVDWASQQAKPGRWLHAGGAEPFFDETQLEVDGHCFEGAGISYDGNHVLGWQTLWYGPWVRAPNGWATAFAPPATVCSNLAPRT